MLAAPAILVIGEALQGWPKYLSFAKNVSAGKALRCRAFVTVMQAAEVGNLDDRSDTRDLPNMGTLLVES